MDTTALGYPYPEGADAITDYPPVAQALAELLNAERTIEGTTIAAIAAAVGGAAQGKRAMLRNANNDRMALVYDSALGKWVGPEIVCPIITGANTFGGSGFASGAIVSCSVSSAPILRCRAWINAGLIPQLRLRGQFDIGFTGAPATREVVSVIYCHDEGGTNPYAAGGNVLSVPISTPLASIGHAWAGPTIGAVTFDWMLASFYLTATGTGTWGATVKNVNAVIRWVSA